MVNINNMPTTIKLLIIQLMITHGSHIPGELRIVDTLLEFLDGYKKAGDYQMPQDVEDVIERLRIMRGEYRQAVDDVLALAESYGLIDQSELRDVSKIYRIMNP